MEDVFVDMLFGHLAGDYLLQSKSMALNKSKKGMEGAAWCLAHCIVYTFAVCVFLGSLEWQVILVVFLAHFPLDRWSLAQKWLCAIRSRDFIEAHQSQGEYREIDIAFSCLVYLIADNTLHLMLMYYPLKHIL